jgi:hypothetical protein
MPISAIQPSFAAGELRPDLHARVDFNRWSVGLATARNFTIRATGGVANRPGTQFLAAAHDESKPVRLLPFIFNDDDTYILEFGENYFRVVRDGALVVYPVGHADEGDIVVVTTAYPAADLAELKFYQSGDRIRFAHRNHPARTLTRSNHHDWAWEVEDFAPEIQPPTGVSASASSSGSKTYRYVVTATDADSGEQSLPSAEVSVNSALLNSGTGVVVDITWTTSTASSWDVYRYDNGLWGWIGQTETNAFTDDNIAPDTATTPPKANYPFADGNNPLSLTEHDQRMVYGGGALKPEVVEGSRIGAYANFFKSTPQVADDSYSHRLGRGNVYEIRHLISLNSLVILTAGSIWQMTGSEGTGDAVTPISVRSRRMISGRASHVPPIVISETALYVRGRSVWNLNYSLEIDGYTGNNMSVLASHLFKNRSIREWAYAEEPDSMVWTVMSDGALLSLSYLREHQVIAWARHDTDGQFESVATIPEGDEDAVYFVVRRTIDGQDRRYIERLARRVTSPIAEAWFLDCALRYQGDAVTTITGLDHLEGCAVIVLADGNVVRGLTVASGSITLPRAAQTVLVGLAITADLMTLGLNFDTRTGSVMGKKVTIPTVLLKLEESRGGWIGPTLDDAKLVELKPTIAANTAAAAFTGDFRQTMLGGWSTRGQIAIRQKDPLPFALLGLVPDIEASNG